MEKTYNPHSIEQRWYEAWEKAGYFTPKGQGDPYCIMIPPPNVTGNTGIDDFLLGTSAAISQIDGGTGANTLMGDKDFSTITAMTTTKRMSGLRGEGETTDR